MDVKEESILGSDTRSHWYYVAKGAALCSFTKNIQVNEVLDIGAGSGVFSRQLLDNGVCESAACVDPAYPKEHSELHNNKPIRFVRSIDATNQKLILMMDVLEHVDDDVGLLRQYTHNLPNDGYVLITVPAFQFLWSGHDVFLEHKRRYTRATLTSVVEKANLEVVKCRYFYGILFPLLAAIRLRERKRLERDEIELKSNLKKLSPIANNVLILIHHVERLILLPFNIFAGLTVICLARKPWTGQ